MNVSMWGEVRREGGRVGGREGGREGEREGGREGGRGGGGEEGVRRGRPECGTHIVRQLSIKVLRKQDVSWDQTSVQDLLRV